LGIEEVLHGQEFAKVREAKTQKTQPLGWVSESVAHERDPDYPATGGGSGRRAREVMPEAIRAELA